MSKPNDIEIQNSGSFLWGLICICIILVAVFLIRQNEGVKVNTRTMQKFVLDESKQQASPIKKYFPAPYSVRDIAAE